MTPSAAPAVSIITPVYNTRSDLPRMLESVLRQSLDRIEHILIDDGSTDGSAEMLDEYARGHASRCIQVIHQPNGGAGAARNRGLKAARGEYVAFLDSDDYLADDFCEVLHHAAVASCADVCRGECLRHDADGRQHPNLEPSNASIRRAGSRLAFWNLYWTAIYRTGMLREHGIGFDPALPTVEDHLFLNQALLACRGLTLCDRIVYHYCIRPGSLSGAGISPAKITAILECYRRIAANLRQVRQDEQLGAAFSLASHLAELLTVFAQGVSDPADQERCLQGARGILRDCPQLQQTLVRSMLLGNYPQHEAVRRACS